MSVGFVEDLYVRSYSKDVVAKRGTDGRLMDGIDGSDTVDFDRAARREIVRGVVNKVVPLIDSIFPVVKGKRHYHVYNDVVVDTARLSVGSVPKENDGVVSVSGLVVTGTLYPVGVYDSGGSRIHPDSVGVSVFVTGGKPLDGVAVHVYVLDGGSDLDGVHSDVGEDVVVNLDALECWFGSRLLVGVIALVFACGTG